MKPIIAICCFFTLGVGLTSAAHAQAASSALADLLGQSAGRASTATPVPAPVQAPNAPADATTHFAKGFDLLKAGDADSAVDEFKVGLKSDPNNATAWFYLGEARLKLGSAELAKAAFEKSISLDPNGRVADSARARLAQNGAPSTGVNGPTTDSTPALQPGIRAQTSGTQCREACGAERDACERRLAVNAATMTDGQRQELAKQCRDMPTACATRCGAESDTRATRPLPAPPVAPARDAPALADLPPSRVTKPVQARAKAGAPDARRPAQEPSTIVLPSGLTLADWMTLARPKIKGPDNHQVFVQAADYRNSYGPVEGLDQLLTDSSKGELAHVSIINATQAASALPVLQTLLSQCPTCVFVRTTLGKARHVMGDFTGAQTEYQAALRGLDPQDADRARVLKWYGMAEDHRPMSVYGALTRTYSHELPTALEQAIAPALNQFYQCLGDVPKGQDINRRVEVTFNGKRYATIAGQKKSGSSSIEVYRGGLRISQNLGPPMEGVESTVLSSNLFGDIYNHTVITTADSKSINTTALERVQCDSPLYPLDQGKVFLITLTTSVSNSTAYSDPKINAEIGFQASFTQTTQFKVHVLDRVETDSIAEAMPWLHLVGPDAPYWEIQRLEVTQSISYSNFVGTSSLSSISESGVSCMLLGPEILISCKVPEGFSAYAVTISQN